MRILVTSPVSLASTRGNRRTADRWAEILRGLHHHVDVCQADRAEESIRDDSPDLLLALHARKSGRAIEVFHRLFPERPLLVTLTGTDLYHDLPEDPTSLRSLEWADRLIVLQAKGVDALPAHHRPKVRVIVQSAPSLKTIPSPREDLFEVCVNGHLRAVKDPLRTAMAARRLPAESRIHILHLGHAVEEEFAPKARQEMAENPRYHWLGEMPWSEALALVARCRLLVLTSLLEGGANVVCEALALGVPVLSTRIDGSVGLLGEDYPGLFPVGDTAALTDLLLRCEKDAEFYGELAQWCRARAPLVAPEAEISAWKALLNEILPEA